MDNVNQTLYIPLYGKSFVSKKGIILSDKKAEEIWEKEGFALKGKAKSKWLAYYMGMRAAVFDKWLKSKIASTPNCVVLHLGCGMDSRILRVGETAKQWYDVDFKSVIDERKKYYQETQCYHMIEGNLKNGEWLEQIPKTEQAIVLLEGVSMYLSSAELKRLFSLLRSRFEHMSVLLDCYTVFAAKMSKIKNPVNTVGVTDVYGIDTPTQIQEDEGVSFVCEHDMTPQTLVDELHGLEKSVFKWLYAGALSKKLYKLYEYES